MPKDPDDTRRAEAVRRLVRARDAARHAAVPGRSDPGRSAPLQPNVLSTGTGDDTDGGASPWTGALRTRLGSSSRPRWTTALIVGALGLWAIAQVLPAFAIVPDDFICSAWPRWDPPATCDVTGFLPTLIGWVTVLLDGWSAIGWSTNVFLLLAIVLWAAGRPTGALVCALGAMAGALVAMAVLEGLVGEAVVELRIREVRIGTLAWIAATILLLAGITGWVLSTRSQVETDGRGRLASLVGPVAFGFGALAIAGGLTVAVVSPALEESFATPAPSTDPTPVPGTVQVMVRQLPRVVTFEGGTYLVEACIGDQVLIDGEPRGTPPFELVIPAGAHEIDGELRRCDITFIPTDR